MASVLIGMGSNIEPELNLTLAAKALREMFEGANFSAVYHSAAIGMDGADFLNACCSVESEFSATLIRARLKALEDLQGRDRSEGSWRPRTLDLDMLMYDGLVVDDELYKYAHAYVPAAELVAIDLPDDTVNAVTLVELRL